MYDRFSNVIHHAYDIEYHRDVNFRNYQKYKKVTALSKVAVTFL